LINENNKTNLQKMTITQTTTTLTSEITTNPNDVNINGNGAELTSIEDVTITTTATTPTIEQLIKENNELRKKLKENERDNGDLNNVDNIEINETTDGLNAGELQTSQQACLLLKDQVNKLNIRLKEMTSLQETTKQNEQDEKNKCKNHERTIRTMKIEKDQLFAQILDLQEEIRVQKQDLQDAQVQRKRAIQEFTENAEKISELRSKNSKLNNQVISQADELDDLKRELKLNNDKQEKINDELNQVRDELKRMQNEKEEEKLEKENQIESKTELENGEDIQAASVIVDDTLNELNAQLNKEIKNYQLLIVNNNTQINELEEKNSLLTGDIQQLKDKHSQLQMQLNAKHTEQLTELTHSKEKEIQFLKDEIDKLKQENEQVSLISIKLKVKNVLFSSTKSNIVRFTTKKV
jgi:DNA repair exonuclease SbcCD ATPase subunit